MDKKYLCGLNIDEISDLAKAGGFTRSQALIAAVALYRKGESGLQKTTRIPASMKKYLLESASPGIYPPVKSEKSADGTVKHLFVSPEGKKYESVYIPEAKRRTVCVSTQSGCRIGCLLCVTGKYGFHGNLSAGDIVNQVISNPFRDKVTHVVFMGMGEPMDNTDNVLKAADILTAECGLAISSRNITVSTVGITSGVKRFLAESFCNLTLSLYSPFPEERIRVIPAEREYPAREIITI
ncbi:MAG TPA: radical SAM protein, partial [Bacteroidales bacterium]|nr:radical SAM protein [Bacteroidales bacterium]